MIFTVLSLALVAPFCHSFAHPTSLSLDGRFDLETLSSANFRRADDSFEVDLTPITGNFGPAAFYLPVKVDSKSYNLVFDTGSDLLFVYSTLLPGSAFPGYPKYDFGEPPAPCDIKPAKFGDSIDYDYASSSTTVSIGNDNKPFQMDIAAIKEVRNMPTYLRKAEVEGILGTSLSPESWLSVASKTSGSITSQFTVDLKLSGNGLVRFGDFDATPISGEIKWLSVIKGQNQWMVYSPSHGNVIFHSATMGIMLSSKNFDSYFNSLGDAVKPMKNNPSYRTVPCHGTTLPDFRINLAGEVWDLEGSQLLGPQVTANGRCLVFVGQAPDDVSYIGIRFIQKYLVMYDKNEREVGIANRPSS